MISLNESIIQSFGYEKARQLPCGKWIALKKMAFTTGLFYGVGNTSHEYRYCYSHNYEAKKAFDEWDGKGEAPGNWIKKKGADIDELGSGAVDLFNMETA